MLSLSSSEKWFPALRFPRLPAPSSFKTIEYQSMIKFLDTANQERNRRGFFANFLEALHESRRCQAMREIHRCQHLFHEAPDFVNSHLDRGGNPSITEKGIISGAAPRRGIASRGRATGQPYTKLHAPRSACGQEEL